MHVNTKFSLCCNVFNKVPTYLPTCTSELQTNYCFKTKRATAPGYSAMLHVKSCNAVKHNSESVFRYFASAVNSN